MNNRRYFLKTALKTTLIIGAGNSLQLFNNELLALPRTKKIHLRFAVISDGHYGQKDTDYTGMHNQMLNWINAEKMGRGLDFAFINGDMFHDDATFLPAVKNHWDKLAMPYFTSHGNHDQTSEESWMQTFGHNWNYGFEQKKIGFLVLNTADEHGAYICPNLDKTRELLAAYNHYERLFIFMHISPIKWTKFSLDCPELMAMFKQQKNLVALFHGHDHDMDGMKKNDYNIPQFFDAHMGGNWGTDYRGYRIVEIMKNGKVYTWQMNPAAGLQVNTNKVG